MWPEIILTSSGQSFFGKIFSAKSFCLHEKCCAEVLSQGTTMIQLPVPTPLRHLRREWTNMSVFVLDGELWDSWKSGAVLHKCFSHSSSLPVTRSPWPTAAVSCCPCPGSASWPEHRGVRLLSVSLQPSPSQKLSVSAPTCSSVLTHRSSMWEHTCYSSSQSGSSVGLRLLGPRDINTYNSHLPNTLIFTFSQPFQSSCNIPCGWGPARCLPEWTQLGCSTKSPVEGHAPVPLEMAFIPDWRLEGSLSPHFKEPPSIWQLGVSPCMMWKSYSQQFQAFWSS